MRVLPELDATRFAPQRFRQRQHHVAHFDAAKVNDVVDHRALGGGERAFPLALRRDLFQFFARGKEPGLFRRATWQEQPAQPCADFEQRREQDRDEFQHPGKTRQSPERKSPEKRLREDGKQKRYTETRLLTR